MQAVSLVGLLASSFWFAVLRLDAWPYRLALVFCVLGLSGVWRLSWRLPVMVDAPGQVLGLLAACCVMHGWWPLGVCIILGAGATKESAPVWAAIWAWNPILLVGLVPVAVRWLVRQGDDVLTGKHPWILAHPFRASWEAHKGWWGDPALWILPWGVGLLALYQPSWQVGVALLAGYLSVLVATDTVRLYQWAFPVVLAAALPHVPEAWLPLVVAAHVHNPWAGPGV